MKKLKYAVILLLGLSIASTMMTSCTKDKDNPNNGGNGGGSYQTKIVGEWELIKWSECLYDSLGAVILEEVFDEDIENFKFTSEGMVSMDMRWWKSDGIVIATYDIKDDILKMRYTDCTEEWTIKEMTNSKMVWEKEWFGNGYSIPNEQGLYEDYDVGRVRHVERLELKKVN